MVLIRAIVRPEKVDTILFELVALGFPAVTKVDVYGRGKQKGIKVGSVSYDEIPKMMLLLIVEDKDKDSVLAVILRYGRTGGYGTYGDGRVFISPVYESYSISEGK